MSNQLPERANKKFFYRPISVAIRTLLIAVAYLLAISYLCWEVYWYKKVGWGFVQWHTHLTPYGFIILALLTVVYLRAKVGNNVLLIFSITGTLFLVECLLLFENPNLEIYKNHICSQRNYYHVWLTSSSHEVKKSEFTLFRHNNSLGFADGEWAKQKTASKRILTIGDSFTEGDGAVKDSCYPTLLNQILNDNSDSTTWEVMNAGVCGSDPVFGYINLQDRLIQYQPDIVFQTFSQNDIADDFKIRGGFERFQPDKTLRYKPVPWWFYPASFSHIAARIFSVLRISTPSMGNCSPEFLREAEQIQKDFVHRYDSLAVANNLTVVMVLLPMRHETEAGKYQYDFSYFKNLVAASKRLKVYDLLPCYRSKIEKSGKAPSSYYWVKDAHHNADGYKMMAECIASYIQAQP